MTILQFESQVSHEGYITLPAMPEYRDRKIVVYVDDGVQKQPVRPTIDDQTEEERRAAGRKFFDSWNGALKGARDMTAKEIRAERLERKYGQ